jgi:membrane-bound lytic murein transglycosylase MltF
MIMDWVAERAMTPDDKHGPDAWMDIERTLQELAQNACVGEE